MRRSIFTTVWLSLFVCGCGQSAPPGGPPPVSVARNSSQGGSSAVTTGDAELPAGYQIQVDENVGAPSLANNFLFVLDASGSMDEPIKPTDRSGNRPAKAFRNRMEAARWAIHEFAAKLPADANIGCVVFDRLGVRVAVPLGTGNRKQFLSAVDEIYPGGKTPLGDAMQRAVDMLEQQYKLQWSYGEYRLIVVTDGEANDGRTTLPEAVEYANMRNFPIHTIGLCMQSDHELRQYSASYKAADNAEDLKAGLEEAVGESPAFDPGGYEQN